MLSEDGRVLLKTSGPDPKTGITKIEFTVAEQGRVRLFVADVLGELALTLIDAVLEAGSYDAEFDRKYLTSGMYMCVLQTPVGSYGRMVMIEK